MNSQCQDFLQLLSEIHTTEKPGHVLVEELAARWCKAEASLASGWRALGQAALAMARQELDDIMIPCSFVHGDFAPWNTRLGDQGLYVFDWERSSHELPVLWDVFHFYTQTAALLGKDCLRDLSLDRRKGERALFALYLLSSTVEELQDHNAVDQRGLVYRREMLATQLSWD